MSLKPKAILLICLLFLVKTSLVASQALNPRDTHPDFLYQVTKTNLQHFFSKAAYRQDPLWADYKNRVTDIYKNSVAPLLKSLEEQGVMDESQFSSNFKGSQAEGAHFAFFKDYFIHTPVLDESNASMTPFELINSKLAPARKSAQFHNQAVLFSIEQDYQEYLRASEILSSSYYQHSNKITHRLAQDYLAMLGSAKKLKRLKKQIEKLRDASFALTDKIKQEFQQPMPYFGIFIGIAKYPQSQAVQQVAGQQVAAKKTKEELNALIRRSAENAYKKWVRASIQQITQSPQLVHLFKKLSPSINPKINHWATLKEPIYVDSFDSSLNTPAIQAIHFLKFTYSEVKSASLQLAMPASMSLIEPQFDEFRSSNLGSFSFSSPFQNRLENYLKTAEERNQKVLAERQDKLKPLVEAYTKQAREIESLELQYNYLRQQQAELSSRIEARQDSATKSCTSFTSNYQKSQKQFAQLTSSTREKSLKFTLFGSQEHSEESLGMSFLSLTNDLKENLRAQFEPLQSVEKYLAEHSWISPQGYQVLEIAGVENPQASLLVRGQESLGNNLNNRYGVGILLETQFGLRFEELLMANRDSVDETDVEQFELFTGNFNSADQEVAVDRCVDSTHAIAMRNASGEFAKSHGTQKDRKTPEASLEFLAQFYKDLSKQEEVNLRGGISDSFGYSP